MLKFRKLNQSGDTILEVLIAVAVLSLILTTSFALANKSSQATRQASERGEASKWTQSEIEELKYFLSSNASGIPTSGYFCIEIPTAGNPTVHAATGISTVADIDDPSKFNNIPSQCKKGADFRYAIFISRTIANPNTYNAYARWDSITGRGPDKVDMIHRVYPDSAANISAITNGSPINFSPPPPPPPPGPFSTSRTGNAYISCVANEFVFGDGFDGCFVMGTSVYGRRAIKPTYSITGNTGAATATVEVCFNQYAGAGTLPEAGYSFAISYDINGVFAGSTNLNPFPTPYAQKCPTFGITTPSPATFNLSLAWTNNIGNDPDLQINSIRVFR